VAIALVGPCLIAYSLIASAVPASAQTLITSDTTISGTFNGNNAPGYFVASGTLTVNNATLENFTTTGGFGSGGGLGASGARDERQQLIPLVILAAHCAPDTEATMLQIQLPLGLNLAEPISLRVDNGDIERQQIQTCNAAGCFVTMTLNDKFVAAMRNGTTLKITVQDASKKPTELPLPLLGFGNRLRQGQVNYG
jgi:hypothetical protein